jgi:hypothetical protein
MRRLNKFLNLPLIDKHLLVESVFLLGTVRLALWLLPFKTLWRLLARVTQATTNLPEVDQTFVDRITWAIAVAGQCLPGARCLALSLVVQVMLARRGYAACLRIGVIRSEEGRLGAHAWVEIQGRIVSLGLADVSSFTPLPPLREEKHEWHRLHIPPR